MFSLPVSSHRWESNPLALPYHGSARPHEHLRHESHQQDSNPRTPRYEPGGTILLVVVASSRYASRLSDWLRSHPHPNLRGDVPVHSWAVPPLSGSGRCRIRTYVGLHPSLVSNQAPCQTRATFQIRLRACLDFG